MTGAQMMNRSTKNLGVDKENMELRQYQPGEMKKDTIIEKLKEKGYRITKQRKLLIDIILEEPCACCKELYILASGRDPGIGAATVYRTVDALEQIGALKRRTAYQLCCQEHAVVCKSCLVELEDNSTVELDYRSMEKIIEKGLKDNGYSHGKRVKNIMLIHAD